ncbi:hypothetical protein [Sphingomicrobium flavum]|uniref:hypothetical protein n=1 Tax=Sphingomicrobium flavum TaxID=1229164 RepID=UPI0021ADD74A|nr:hypothetical protein [Sphingomicrobium flavum]
MTTTYAATTPELRRSDRIFHTGIGLYVLLLGLIGFGRSFYFSSFTGGVETAPAFTATIMVHAALFTAWIVLATSQPWLIAKGRYDLHRQYGPWGMGLGIAMILSGVYTALIAANIGFNDQPNRANFMIVPFVTMLGFGLFLWLSWRARRNGEAHKRYILLAHVNLLEAPAARSLVHNDFPPMPGIIVLTFLPVLAGIIYDLVTRRRVHAIYLWGGALSFALAVGRHSIARSDWWGELAPKIAAPFA